MNHLQWRVWNSVEGYLQHDGGISSALWRVFSTVKKYYQYIGGISSVRWRIFSTVEWYHQYVGGIPEVHRNTVRTSEDIKCCGGLPSVHQRMLSAVEGYYQYIWEIPWLRWRIFSTVEYPPSYWKYPSILLKISIHRTAHCRYTAHKLHLVW